MRTVLVLALLAPDELVFRPCVGVEPGSWLWWAKGCFLYQVETWLALAALVIVAGLSARLWRWLAPVRRAA